MKADEQNRAIAEWAGTDQRWTVMKRGLYYRPDAKGYTNRAAEAWVLTEAEADKETYPYDEPVTKHRLPIPNYFADLNAIHEAEKKLTVEQHKTFREQLCVICIGIGGPISATAPKRCEALLRTIGLWKESSK